MRRNFKSGHHSNNSIKYNSFSNKKMKNISYIKFDENDYKINSSNSKKNLTYEGKYFKMNIDYEDEYYDEEYD